MSTPAENIGANVTEVTGPSLSAEDAWITELGLNDPIDGSPAPLPTESNAGAGESAAVEAGKETPEPAAAEADTKAGEPKVEDGKAAAPAEEPKTEVKAGEAGTEVEAKPAGDAAPEEPAAAAATEADDAELTTSEKDLISKLPEAEQPGVKSKLKRAFFMDHYLNPDKPADEVRQHLEERSPSRYAELETSILAKRIAEPEPFLANLYQQDPEKFGKLAVAVFRGDPKYFVQQVTGRDDVTPEAVKTAIEFHERYKDRVSDDVTLSALDEAKITEMEEYFPEEAKALRAELEAKARLAEENQNLKKQLEEANPADPDKEKKAEATQQETVQREIQEVWDLGRDTVAEFVSAKAYDPAKGIGIHVTEDERKNAPAVALLKDVKASLFFDGLEVGNKTILPKFEKGLVDWGESRKEFKERILHMDKFTQARERDNVIELARSVFPFADSYYNERLQHPIFAQIDALIALAAEKGLTAPKYDKQIPGNLPARTGSGAHTDAHPDAWLIDDAVKRAQPATG